MKIPLIVPVLCFAGAAIAQSMTPDERAAHLQWMRQALPDVPEWTAWQQKTGELPPDFDALPRSNLLPDPLRFADGRPVRTDADWEARRAEIRGFFEKYVTGTFPPKPSISSVVLLDEARANGCITRNVRVEFGPRGKGSVRVRLVIPDAAAGEKLPVLISPNLAGWARMLVRRGYISAGFAGNDRMDDAAALQELYPDYDFATLPRRAWLAQVVLDYLETVPQADMSRVAIFGYSRDGKMATIAAALDARIAALVAGSTGVGGLLPWRLGGERGGGESIESTTRMFPSWFSPRLRFFSGREDRLPVDANLFLALIAPRAVLSEWGNNDQVANGWAIEQAHASAQAVYERLGRPERLGLLHVPGFHGSNDPEACIDWLDWQFGRAPKKWVNDFVFQWDFEKWRALTGEKIDLEKFPVHDASKAGRGSDAEGLRRSVGWMLGEAPPLLPEPPPLFPSRRGGPPPGPTVVAQGRAGNPGQLAPDVPAWVIAAGGQEYGWREPEKNAVASRRLRFGLGVTGDLYYPADTPAGTKLPAVIWLHGFHHPLGYMWVYRRDLHPILALVKAGYAVLAYDQTGYGTRWAEAAPFYDRHPRWSRLGKMVEDARGAVDALEKDALVDAKAISVFGYTLGGTVGLYAAALDPRIRGVVSICGFTPMRADTPVRGMSGMTRYSHQHGLLPRLGLFAGDEARLPYDYEDLIALAAPRPVLIVQPRRDRDASPADVRAAVDRARRAYEQSGAASRLALQEPDDYGRLAAATQDAAIAWMRENLSD
ncbi:MAG: dienelactone hydrolase family protein [Opitutaceae bacterium]|jgi:dienelactone hydrolase|nr:dienelactone hydrolase family protein [Opitutaceae bacterium]